jgi:hypothetical protein
MYIDIRFEEENFEEDRSGENGPEAKRRTVAMLKKAAKETKGMDAYSFMVMGLEEESARIIRKKARVKPHSRGRESYNDDGSLSVFIPIDTYADVVRARDILDMNGRSYNLAAYIEATGAMLFPQGINGPRFGTEGSPIGNSSGHDIDDWIEDHAPKAKRAPRKRTR